MQTPTNTLSVISAVAIYAEIEVLLSHFTRRHSVEVAAKYDVNPAVAQRVMDGEEFDVGLNNHWYVDEMIRFGRVAPNVNVPFGRIPLTIGAAGLEAGEIVENLGDICSLLFDADSIAYTSTGTSGATFLRALEMLGLKDRLQNRLRPMGAGEPPVAAAKGEVQYAVAPLSRIIAAPGIRPVATFPSKLRGNIDMSMFICKRTRSRTLAMKLVRFLANSEFDNYLSSHGVYRYQARLNPD